MAAKNMEFFSFLNVTIINHENQRMQLWVGFPVKELNIVFNMTSSCYYHFISCQKK